MQVVELLSCRLKVGGVWYGRGDAVELDEEDARVYRARGLSSPAPAGTIARNARVIPPTQIGLVTKVVEEPIEATLPPVSTETAKAETVKVQHHGKRPR